jgi:hypothetical protein
MASVLLVGCYTLQPTRGVVPANGTEVAFDISDAGRVALGGSMGPEISQIEGRLVSKDGGEYDVAVTAVRLLRGGEQVWRGERVHIKQEHVTTIYEKRFSKGRTIALSAAGIGAVAIMASQGILGGGQAEPGKTPGDTSQSSRGRKP